jgi:hypothetical protein
MKNFSDTNIQNLDSEHPLDDVVANTMTTIARKGRGFVLDTAAGSVDKLNYLRGLLTRAITEKTATDRAKALNSIEVMDAIDGTIRALAQPVIEVREALKPHDEWEAPVAWRDHKLQDTDSFIRYSLRYGTQENSLVLFDKSKFTLVINERVERGLRETIDMEVSFSDDWKEWSTILNKPLGHKDLLVFCMKHEHNFVMGGVLASMQSMKINAVINVESDIRDEGNEVGIMIKTNAGEELRRFPKQFDIVLPILEQDVGEDVRQMVKLRLNTQLPDDGKSGATFTIFCSEWKQILVERVRQEGARVRDSLPDWTVVHGTYGIEARKIGTVKE